MADNIFSSNDDIEALLQGLFSLGSIEDVQAIDQAFVGDQNITPEALVQSDVRKAVERDTAGSLIDSGVSQLQSFLDMLMPDTQSTSQARAELSGGTQAFRDEFARLAGLQPQGETVGSALGKGLMSPVTVPLGVASELGGAVAQALAEPLNQPLNPQASQSPAVASSQPQQEVTQLQDALAKLQAQSAKGSDVFVARGDTVQSGTGQREGDFQGQFSRFSQPDASVLKERIQGRAQIQAQEMIQSAQMQKAVNDIELDRATELMVQLSKLGPAQQTQALVELGFTELDDLKKQISAIKERNTLLDKRLKDTLKAQMAKLGLK